MSGSEGTESIAYCGLVCAVCSHAAEGCRGCRKGGGPEACYKRQCCGEQGLEGCWQCESVPCERGFDDPAWSGLTAGCIQMIRAMGVAAFASLARSRLGDGFDYGYLRYRTAAQIEAILRGEAEVPLEDPDEA
jgi:hypothetical protein